MDEVVVDGERRTDLSASVVFLEEVTDAVEAGSADLSADLIDSLDLDEAPLSAELIDFLDEAPLRAEAWDDVLLTTMVVFVWENNRALLCVSDAILCVSQSHMYVSVTPQQTSM